MYKLLSALLALMSIPCSTAALADGPEARAILQRHCAGCHGGGAANKGGFGFVLDRDLLVSRLLVTPGRVDQSDLFTRVQQGEMPPKSSKTRPSPAEQKILQRWIEAGAPAFDDALPTAKALTPGEVTAAILADLQALDPRRHRHTRYLTLSHLAFAGRSGQDLATLREAAGKLLNSLSWHPRIARPEPVDAGALLLRIDLRAFKWNAALWEKLVAVYPYRLQTAAESKALAGFTGSEYAALRADWFAANACRPPLYHDLLQLPTSDRALERLLQVDAPGDIQDDNIQRSGFNDSGVSKNNRILERHDAAYGTLWRSYDFKNNTGRQNLFEHPLGPNAGATSFQPAGGEMIFHLPNGLQAYLLVDAKGRRIDKGPTEIVADPRRPDQRVETGVSCMSCHARGLLFKADQLRGHVEKNAAVFGNAVVAAVRATHPRKAKLQAQIEEDNRRYLQALASFGVRDPDQEPINLVTQRHEATLDGRTAAAELGLGLDDFAAFLQANPDDNRVFGSLLVKGGTAQRTTFQDRFPELARRLLAQQALAAAKTRPKLQAAFAGHTATVNAIAFSSDGTQAASAGDDRAIRVWEVPTGRLLAAFEGSTGEVYALAFSRDGKSLLSAGRDRVLRLWDVPGHKQVRVLRGHTDAVRSVAFSPDGKRAVSGGDDRALRIWDIAAGEEQMTLDGHAAPVTSLVWGPDGKILSGSGDASVRWWDVRSKKQLAILEGHVGPVLTVALTADGKAALSGGNDHTVRYWRLDAAKEIASFKGHPNAVVQVQFHRDGKAFLSASSQHRNHDDCWRSWNLTERREIAARQADAADRFGCAAISPDGRFLLIGGPAGFLRLLRW